jgi:hypothetical protein
VLACISGGGSLEPAVGGEVEVLNHRQGLSQQISAGSYNVNGSKTMEQALP